VSRWIRAVWERAVGLTLIGLGSGCIIAGYWGVSGTRRLSEQAAYLASGGLGGLLLVGWGAVCLLWADLRDLDHQVSALEAVWSTPPVGDETREPAPRLELTVTSFETRRHRTW
jgi:hypothetical protein